MDYVKEATRTDDQSQETIQARGKRASDSVSLLHGAIGLCTEVGEFQDAIKRHIFYGKELDKVNLREEIGDIMWYLAVLCKELGITFEEAQVINIKKLEARYPKGFTNDSALNRDLNKEKSILVEGI